MPCIVTSSVFFVFCVVTNPSAGFGFVVYLQNEDLPALDNLPRDDVLQSVILIPVTQINPETQRVDWKKESDRAL